MFTTARRTRKAVSPELAYVPFAVLPVNVEATGAYIALGDVNHDGTNDIVIGADAGWVPQVERVRWLDRPFDAHGTGARGSTRLRQPSEAAFAWPSAISTRMDGSATGAGRAEIVTATGRAQSQRSPTRHLRSVPDRPDRGTAPFYPFPSTMTAGPVRRGRRLQRRPRPRCDRHAGAGVAPRMNIFSGKGLMTPSGLAETPTWEHPGEADQLPWRPEHHPRPEERRQSGSGGMGRFGVGVGGEVTWVVGA